MSALGDILGSWIEPYLDWPLLSSLFGTLSTLALALATSYAIYRFLQSQASRLSPGPVFMFGALTMAIAYVLLLSYAAATGHTFEEVVLLWLGDATALPLDGLGAARGPLLLNLLYAGFQTAYLLVVCAVAWLLGLFSKEREESVAAEIEAELGSSVAMRFYRLCGYHRPDAPENRFHAYATELVRALRWVRWLSLPAVFTGAIPVALWVVGSIVYDGMQRNLTPPPATPDEEERGAEEETAALTAQRDPSALVDALQKDQRGPELRMLGGGMLEGAAEHSAERTRLRDESRIMSDVLDALGIEGFYVHQEAAAEAILAEHDVLMETSPLSGRRTLCDVLAMRAVLLEGGTVLYVSPSAAESARRARAFRRVAQASNWRWAIYHHELAASGREGIDLRLRQPQIVFTTVDALHGDICRLHDDWDYFLQSLALVVCIDLDRHVGPRGTSMTFVMRRLTRLVRDRGAAPNVLATVAPYGPDVQGFAERLMGRPFEVVGPESNSRGAPPQYVVVGTPKAPQALHEAVSSRGVAIACGYNTEIWGHGAVLTDFEQEQQVNKVLLSFSKAVVSPGDDDDARFDDAHAIVVRMSSSKAAMIPFFTRHTGRKALGVRALLASEIGARKETEEGPAIPFAGFERHEEQIDVGVIEQAPAEDTDEADGLDGGDEDEGGGTEEEEAAAEEEAVAAALLEAQPELAVAIWLPDEDAFAHLLAQHPQWVHPTLMHPMMQLGSRLVSSLDNAALTVRHMLSAASELPLSRDEAAELFSSAALDAVIERADLPGLLGDDEELLRVSERLVMRPRLRLASDGVIHHEDELVLDGGLLSRGSTETSAMSVTDVVNRAGGETVTRVDTVRALAAMYPGRVFVRGGRRYRVVSASEQTRTGEGRVLVEPERRRIATHRIRHLELAYDGEGHALSLGGDENVRFHQTAVTLRERIIGVQQRQRSRHLADALHYDAPIEVSYRSRATMVRLPEAPASAYEAVERLARVTLPAFIRHEEEDLDVSCDDQGVLAFVDRHPGGAGYARAITTDVVRHVLYWSRKILSMCGAAACEAHDGCQGCVYGTPRLTPVELRKVSRKAALALLDGLLAPDID